MMKRRVLIGILATLALSALFFGGWFFTVPAVLAPPPAQPEAVPAAPPEVVYRFRNHPPPTAAPEDFDYSRLAEPGRALPRFRGTAFILVDLDSRVVLAEKNSRRAVPIASLTKLMTIYTAFELLEKYPAIGLETPVTVSTGCTRVRPVRFGWRAGDTVTVNELFMSAMLKSANDSAELIAEYFGGGDAKRFIAAMNRQTARLNMRDSVFFNAHGLPIYAASASEATLMNRSSCRDLAILIEQLYAYPLLRRYCRTTRSVVKGRPLGNSNRLLGSVPGVDGLKTGYTAAAGHCLAFSCVRDGRRLAGVAVGFNKRPRCFEFAAALLNWGYKQTKYASPLAKR